MLTADQLAQRRLGITATDMTKIAGVSPYGGAQDVLDSKRGVSAPFVVTDRVKWGNLLEPVVRDDYAERFGFHVEVPGTIVDQDLAWAMATPDGIAYRPRVRNPDRGLEIKMHTRWLSDDYGEPGTDDVARHEIVQCQWNMKVCNLPIWDLVVFMDGQPIDYQVNRDDELIGLLTDLGAKFYRDQMVAGIDLEPDGSQSYTDHLDRIMPKDSAPEYIEATETDIANAIALKMVRANRADLMIEEEELVQRLKMAIGDNAGITIPDLADPDKTRRITWKKSKAGSRTDWRSAFGSLVEVLGVTGSAHAVSAVADNTTTTLGSRRFCVPKAWKK
jgi:putative phage-type endonuclease